MFKLYTVLPIHNILFIDVAFLLYCVCLFYNGVAMIFFGGATRYIFRHLSGSRPHSVGGGGVAAEIFRALNTGSDTAGGGG